MIEHDLTRAFAKWLTAREDRPDDGLLHVGQVANSCTRATWHEVKHGLKKEFDAVTQCKFRQGEQIESLVRDALVAHYSALGWSYDDYGQHKTCEVLPAVQGAPSVVGHPDLVFRHPSHPPLLIEVKSSMLFYDRIRKGVFMPTVSEMRIKNPNYILQGAAYAHAKEINAPEFHVFLVDRGTGQFADYAFTTADEWPAFSARMFQMLDTLKTENEPDIDLPTWTLKADGSSFLCRQCPVLTCERWSAANKMFKQPVALAPR